MRFKEHLQEITSKNVKLKIKKDTKNKLIIDFKSGDNTIRFQAGFTIFDNWIIDFGVLKRDGFVDPTELKGDISNALITFSGVKKAMEVLFKKHDPEELSFGPASNKLQKIYALMGKKHGFDVTYDGVETLMRKKR